MPHVSVNGARLYVEDTGGDGPAVVFSHGNLMDHEMWEHQVGVLATEFRCVVWDERLHGRTEDDGALYTYWDSASDLLGLLDALGIERATLVGHSQGGFLSMRAALLAPERVRALALTDTAAAAWPPEVVQQMTGIAEAFRGAGPGLVAPALLDMLLDQPPLHGRWLAKWQAQPAERLADAVTVLSRADDITDRIGELAAATLVVHGADDQPVPHALGELLRDQIPGARQLVTVPGAGHTPNLTHPEQVNAPLAAFLRAHA